jgi:hypothetical protein
MLRRPRSRATVAPAQKAAEGAKRGSDPAQLVTQRARELKSAEYDALSAGMSLDILKTSSKC